MRTGNKAPMVSVIIPIYNTPIEMFTKCTESLVMQKGEYEFIFIDDGSSVDYIEPIMKELMKKDNRVRYIFKTNTGVSNTRNVGIRHAKGKYIMFVDSDDYLFPNAIEYACRSIEEFNSDVLLLSHMHTPVEKTKKILTPDEERTLKIGVLAFRDSYFYKMGINIDAPWAKLFKREIIEKNNIMFFEDIHRSEDALFDFYVYEYSNTIAMDNTLVYSYESNPTSICSSYSDKDMRIVSRILDYKYRIVEKFYKDDVDFISAIDYSAVKAIIDADVRLLSNEERKLTIRQRIEWLGVLLNDKFVKESIHRAKFIQVPKILDKFRLFLYKKAWLSFDIIFFLFLHKVKNTVSYNITTRLQVPRILYL